MRILPAAYTIVLVTLIANPLLAEESPGISKTKPGQGRFVEIKGGFMVPYTMTIPGTEAELTMLPIPGGEFLLGSAPADADKQADEQPQVRVRIEPFWMARTEVCWAEYLPFMDLYEHFKEFEHRKMRLVNKDNPLDAITAPTELYDPSFTFEYGEEPQQPAVTMTQYAAKQYTKWVSGVTGHRYRLPSEAEWEYACRAGTTTAYHFGDDPKLLDDYAWHIGNTPEQPQDVGSKKPNPWGLHDMHGGVWEWVLDGYAEDGYQQLAKKSKGKTLAAKDAVTWPTKAYPRVVRGGSWEEDPARCRAAAKIGSDDPEWKLEDPNLPLSPWWFTSDPSRGVGFRMIRPLEAPTKQEKMAKYWETDHEDIKFDVDGRLSEGRGVLGLVDPDLPAAIKSLED